MEKSESGIVDAMKGTKANVCNRITKKNPYSTLVIACTASYFQGDVASGLEPSEAKVTDRIECRNWLQDPWGGEEQWGVSLIDTRTVPITMPSDTSDRILLPRLPPHLILTPSQDNSKAPRLPKGEVKLWFFWPRLLVSCKKEWLVVSRELRKNVEYTIITHAKSLKKKEDGKNMVDPPIFGSGIVLHAWNSHRLLSEPSKPCVLAPQEGGRFYRKQSGSETSLTAFDPTKSLSHPKIAQRIRVASKQSGPIRNEVQVAFHVNHSEATSILSPVYIGETLNESRLGTEKSKVTRGDRLVYQRIMVDLILSVLANGGGPSPSTMTIVVEDGVTESRPCPKPSRIDLYRDRIGSISTESDSAIIETSQYSTSQILQSGQMENNDRTLKELATPDVVYQPWCIQYPQLEPAQTYELKSGLIHLLPKFHGLTGEDPHKHLKEFHVVCSIMKSQGISEDYIKMKTFLFSLDGAAKDWLYLQPVLFNTWGDIKRTFLEKFFPASRNASIKKEICGIRQHTEETLYEYWERFNKLCATCPHHHISEQLLIQYFYEGLSMMDKSIIDAASGGALMDKMPAATRHLISNMASNTQQFGIRGPNQSQMVNEIGAASNQRLENQLNELTSLGRQLVVGQHQPTLAAKVSGICTFVEHPTDMCPTLQETDSDQPENVGAIGGFQYGKQPY
ncbi:hypothetical protein CR513_24808, partial [Mucuna pruriens]